MMGMEMMLKAMGLDAEKITETFNGIGKHVAEQTLVLRRVEAKLDALLDAETVARINGQQNPQTGVVTID